MEIKITVNAVKTIPETTVTNEDDSITNTPAKTVQLGSAVVEVRGDAVVAREIQTAVENMVKSSDWEVK